MRGLLRVPVPSLAVAATGLVLLAQPARPVTHHTPHRPAARQEGAVTAADRLAWVRTCAPVSRGHYRSDAGAPADIPVCGTGDAVFWTADLDIDCDGRPGPHCNSASDPWFSDATAYPQSDGRPLSAETLPYIVVPAPSSRWDPREQGVRGGSVAAVVHGDRVQYAVVGDTGSADAIGEASYATAAALGLPTDPRTGGAPSGVTYIVFGNSRATPIEDHAAAVETGERLARAFVHARGTSGDRRPTRDQRRSATATPSGSRTPPSPPPPPRPGRRPPPP